MNLTEAALRDAIRVDFNAEIGYGSDQVFDTYPCRFATVDMYLMQTDALTRCVDAMRVERGFKPMIGDNDDDCDLDGWYDCYISLNDYGTLKIDSAILCIVCNSQSDDNEESYLIDLTESEQAAIFRIIDEQCREHIGRSCDELLAESRAELLEEIRYEEVLENVGS